MKTIRGNNLAKHSQKETNCKIKTILENIILIILMSAPILVVGYVLFIVALLSLKGRFYGPIILSGVVFLIFVTVSTTFNLVNPKLIKKMAALFLLFCGGAIAVYEVDIWLDESKIIREVKYSLKNYEPFEPQNKVATLNEKSTFAITDNLPKLDGATALYPLYAAFVQAAYPEKIYNLYREDIEVVCNTTTTAYRNLIEGKADIIFVAAPSAEQLEMAAQKGVELKLTPIGREAFVFFVNSQNKIDNLSLEQIQGIYTGEIISRAANYRNYNNALGYSFHFFATDMAKNDQIRLLKINGVYPDKDTIGNKTYPLVSDFYAITAGSKNPNVEPFINWILSPQGQYLVEATGYTALPKR